MRHGTTDWNREHRIQGRTDIPLDGIGRRMAKDSGEALTKLGIRFDRVYSSPLKRAYETAELLCPGQEIVTDERLIELSFGECEGKVSDGLLADGDHPFRFFKKDPVNYNRTIGTVGGETLDGLMARTREFMQQVIEPLASVQGNASVLISGHGAMNRGLLMYIRNTNDLSGFWGTGLQANCGITKVTLTCDKYTIVDNCRIYYDKDLMIDPEFLIAEHTDNSDK